MSSIDSDDIGTYCETCRKPIYVGDRVIQIVQAGQWYDGHTSTGQLTHFTCLTTGLPEGEDE